MPAATTPSRLAVDIGGTFTDVVLELPTGERITTKLLTTYDHPGKAVLEGHYSRHGPSRRLARPTLVSLFTALPWQPMR